MFECCPFESFFLIAAVLHARSGTGLFISRWLESGYRGVYRRNKGNNANGSGGDACSSGAGGIGDANYNANASATGGTSSAVSTGGNPSGADFNGGDG
eukprot:152232-Pleurochrysis_carterae.AAC.2